MSALKYVFYGLIGAVCVELFKLDLCPRIRAWWMRRQLRILEPTHQRAKEDLAMLAHLQELESDYRRGTGL